MKIAIIILLITFSSKCFSQVGSPILGKWKVVSVSYNDIYYHSEKDSIVVDTITKAQIKSKPKDSSMVVMMREAFQLLASVTFKFHSDGRFEQVFPDSDDEYGVELSYTVDEKKKEILKKTKTASSTITESLPFSWKENILQITMYPGSPNPMIFELRKMENL